MVTGALPLRVVEDPGAVGARVEVRGDAPGGQSGLLGERLEHAVHPVALAGPVGPGELDVDDHDAAGLPGVALGPEPGTVVLVRLDSDAFDAGDGGVDLGVAGVAAVPDEFLVRLFAGPLGVVQQRRAVLPRVHAVGEQSGMRPLPALPDLPDGVDGFPLPLRCPHVPGAGLGDRRVGAGGVRAAGRARGPLCGPVGGRVCGHGGLPLSCAPAGARRPSPSHLKSGRGQARSPRRAARAKPPESSGLRRPGRAGRGAAAAPFSVPWPSWQGDLSGPLRPPEPRLRT